MRDCRRALQPELARLSAANRHDSPSDVSLNGGGSCIQSGIMFPNLADSRRGCPSSIRKDDVKYIHGRLSLEVIPFRLSGPGVPQLSDADKPGPENLPRLGKLQGCTLHKDSRMTETCACGIGPELWSYVRREADPRESVSVLPSVSSKDVIKTTRQSQHLGGSSVGRR